MADRRDNQDDIREIKEAIQFLASTLEGNSIIQAQQKQGYLKPSKVIEIVTVMGSLIFTGSATYYSLREEISGVHHKIEFLQVEDDSVRKHIREDEEFVEMMEERIMKCETELNNMISSNANSHRGIIKRLNDLENK